MSVTSFYTISAYSPLYLGNAPSPDCSTSGFSIYAQKYPRKTISHKISRPVVIHLVLPLDYTAFSIGSQFPSVAFSSLKFSFIPRESVTVTKYSFIVSATSTSLDTILSPSVKTILF